MQGRQITMPPISKTNKVIISTLVVSFLIVSALRIAGIPHWSFLVLAKETFMGFQLLTYALVDMSIISLIFNALLFWFLGGELEQSWGKKFYIQFILSLLVGGGLIFLAISFSPFGQALSDYRGTAGIISGLLVGYAMMYGERELHFMFFFPLKAKYFCILIAGIQLYGAFFSLNKQSAIAHLFTMALAFGILYWKALSSRKARRNEEFKQYQRENLKKSFKLIKNDEKKDDNDPRYWQ